MSTRIMNQNYANLDTVANATVSSEQTSFPDDNLYNEQRRSKVWRSNGYWDIDGTNNTIVLDAGSGDVTATVAVAKYTSTSTVFTALETALDAVGGGITFTLSQDASTNLITITPSSSVTMKWTQGTMPAILGFDTAVDETDTVFVADQLRLHTEEWIKWDFGLATSPKAFIVIGKRNAPIAVSPSATLKLQGSETDAWDSPTFETTIAYDDAVMKSINADGIHTDALRYWRFQIIDKDNANGYVELGTVYLGDLFQATRGAVQFPFNGTYIDRSTTAFSEGGQTFSDIKPKSEQFSIRWFGLTIAEKEQIDDIFDTFGTSKPFFIQLDKTPAFSSTDSYYLRYCKFSTAPSYSLVSPGVFGCNMALREEL